MGEKWIESRLGCDLPLKPWRLKAFTCQAALFRWVLSFQVCFWACHTAPREDFDLASRRSQKVGAIRRGAGLKASLTYDICILYIISNPIHTNK